MRSVALQISVLLTAQFCVSALYTSRDPDQDQLWLINHKVYAAFTVCGANFSEVVVRCHFGEARCDSANSYKTENGSCSMTHFVLEKGPVGNNTLLSLRLWNNSTLREYMAFQQEITVLIGQDVLADGTFKWPGSTGGSGSELEDGPASGNSVGNSTTTSMIADSTTTPSGSEFEDRFGSGNIVGNCNCTIEQTAHSLTIGISLGLLTFLSVAFNFILIAILIASKKNQSQTDVELMNKSTIP